MTTFTLPLDLNMRNVAHGSGAKGRAFYVYEDALDLGVVQFVERQAKNQPFREQFLFKWLPDENFGTYAALRIRTSVLTEEMIAAEKARWPQIGSVTEGDHEANKCMRHRDRRSVLRASAKTCWIPFYVDTCGLCEECRPAAATAQGIVDVVNERRENVKKALAQLGSQVP